jgi:hypothetical protein
MSGRTMKLWLLVIALCLMDCTLAAAQPPAKPPFGRPPSGPTVSPYLNLTRRGTGNAAINYFGIVRPQQQFYREVRQLEGDLANQQGEIQGRGSEPELPTTGHAASFQNYSHFYNFAETKSGGTSGFSSFRPSSGRSVSRASAAPISRSSSTSPTTPRPMR